MSDIKTSFGWLEVKNYATDPTDTDATRAGFAIVAGAAKFWDGSTWAAIGSGGTAHAMLSATHTDSTVGTIARGDIITAQGATAKWTKLAKGTAGQYLLMGAEEPAWGTLSLVNADINAAAAITAGKLALATGSMYLGTAGVAAALDAKGDGKIIVGDGSTAASVSVIGDVTLANTGATTVTDLTITSEAQGDVLYFDGTNWVRLGAGDSGKYLKTRGAAANPMWDTPVVGYADALASPFTVEGGTYDPATTVTPQTTSAAALTIPDLAGVAQEWVFSKKAQTLEAKTLTSPNMGTSMVLKQSSFDYTVDWADPAAARTITFGDPGGADSVVYLAATQALTGKTVNKITITQPATGATLTIAEGKTLTANATLTLAGTDAKTLTVDANTTIGANAITFEGTQALTLTATKAVTFADEFITSGAHSITLTATGATTVTLPTTGTLLTTDSTATLTNKTLDCDGTGNVVTNIEASELKNVADATAGVPIIIRKSVAALAAAGTNVITTHAKMRVIDAWFVATSADSGTIQLKVGQVGSVGAAITEEITVTANDKKLTRSAEIDDATWEVAEDAGLVAVGDVGASIDGDIFVMAIRVA